MWKPFGSLLVLSMILATSIAPTFGLPDPTRRVNISSQWIHDYQDMRWLAARRLGPDCPVSSIHNPFRPALINDWAAMVNDELGLFRFAADGCPSYRSDKFKVKPVAAQQWWDKQQKIDQGKDERKCDPLVPQAPRFVSYICCDNDQGPGLPPVNQFQGINVIILSFLEINGPGGKLADFYKASYQERHDWIKSLHDRNISVLLSAFGGDPSQQAITMKFDPVALGRLHGEIVRESGLDGLDNDLEDFQASMVQNHDVAEWIVQYTRAVRSQIPRGKYALSTAPIAPWFTTNEQRYCSGLFRQVAKEVGDEYDWYNLQFYNQGENIFTDCNSILFKSNFQNFDGSSVFEIHNNTGIPLDKLVIGKPASQEDADSGYISPSLLSQCIGQAHKKGWNAGVMAWQWPNANSRWFQQVRGRTFPL